MRLLVPWEIPDNSLTPIDLPNSVIEVFYQFS
jgi:hypothetical protein